MKENTINGRTPREWLEKYLDTDDQWLIDAYRKESLVQTCLHNSAHLGHSVPEMRSHLAMRSLKALNDRTRQILNLRKLNQMNPTEPADH